MSARRQPDPTSQFDGPMTQALQIDRDTGHVRLGDFLITPATTPAQLDQRFSLDEASPAMVGDRQVFCRFAHASLQQGRLGIRLGLRFEPERLVSLFIELTDPQIACDSDDDFYASIPERERLHRNWLARQLGDTGPTFPWGNAGVARNKSENFFIYLHNRNNEWVFGG
jgi:hypothetical protein